MPALPVTVVNDGLWAASQALQSNAKALFVLKALKRALENKGYPQPLNKSSN